MTNHSVQLTLHPGVRTNFTCDNLLFSMLPNSQRGGNQAYINGAVVEFHQSQFSHMRLTLGEYLDDLCEKYQAKPASVISAAVAWHNGRHSKEIQSWQSELKPTHTNS